MNAIEANPIASPQGLMQNKYQLVGERTFNHEDQLSFAELSGDYNFIHVDPLYSRRSLFGSVVVHGIHSVLCGLEYWLASYANEVTIRSLKAEFNSPLRVDEATIFTLRRINQNQLVIEIRSKRSVGTRLKIVWRSGKEVMPQSFVDDCPVKQNPKLLSKTEICKSFGRLDLYLKHDIVKSEFPNLHTYLSPNLIATLLATTRLVGMHCPGVNSLFSEVNLHSDKNQLGTGLTYDAKDVDDRFGLLTMNIQAPGLCGSIKAFERPSPQIQRSFKEMKASVNNSEFSNQRALIIGGTRGLGEVTAKLLAAGGADVKITYFQGKNEAREIVTEINQGGGTADCFSLNVIDDNLKLADRFNDDWLPTHLYYFATPFISQGDKGFFSKSTFMEFCQYYIFGFQNIVQQLSELDLRAALYPSTIFIDKPPVNMGEYTASKAAGEILCNILESTKPTIKFSFPRLPKLATDQTANTRQIKEPSPELILLQYIRELQGTSG